VLATELKDKEKNEQMVEEFNVYQPDVSVRVWKTGKLQRLLTPLHDPP